MILFEILCYLVYGHDIFQNKCSRPKSNSSFTVAILLSVVDRDRAHFNSHSESIPRDIRPRLDVSDHILPQEQKCYVLQIFCENKPNKIARLRDSIQAEKELHLSLRPLGWYWGLVAEILDLSSFVPLD